MKLIHVLPLLIYISFQIVHLLYSNLQEYSMTTIGCFLLFILHTFGPWYFLLCYTLWIIIEHPCSNILISLYNLSCIFLLLWRMNHLTLCSNNFITSFITCTLQYLIKFMMVACHFKNYFVLSFTYSRTSRN